MMSTSANMDKRTAAASAGMKQEIVKKEEIPIPDTIEEKRKDTDGRVVIVNRYLRGNLLGKGGFAKCFVGTVTNDKDRLVALKIVDKTSLVKDKAKQKLQTEISIHRKLNHMHIVKFERFFEDSTHVYITLELCTNNSMTELMKRRKTLIEPEVRFYVSQIVQALKYLHEKCVIHRDLKLGNLFIDHEMRIKIGDFGLATKLTCPTERKRTVCGTPNYIAPEILEGKEGHSFEVDIWSTGVLIYTLLFGKPPFESKDVKATYKRILSNNYGFPDHSDVNDSARALIRHMLQNCPTNRPKLEGIVNSDFFALPAFTPTFLPQSALRIAPNIPNETVTSFAANKPAPYQLARPGVSNRPINDENDPNAINHHHHAMNQAHHEVPIKSAFNPNIGVNNVNTNLELNRFSDKQTPAWSKSVDTRKPLARLEEMILPNANTATAQPQRAVTRSQAPQKFDVYSDLKQMQATTAASSSTTITGKRTSAAAGTVVSEQQYKQRPTTGRLSSSSQFDASNDDGFASRKRLSGGNNIVPPFFGSVSNNQTNSCMDVCDSGNQHCTNNGMDIESSCKGNSVAQFEYPDAHALGNPTNSRLSGSAMDYTSSRGVPVSKQAWEGSSELPYEELVSNNKPLSNGLRSGPSTRSSTGRASVPAPGPLFISPPKEVIVANKMKEPNTLEAMHDNLNAKLNFSCDMNKMDMDSVKEKIGYDMWTDEPNLLSSNQPTTYGEQEQRNKLNAANLWIVRYVDYTSKYGLGFLLNNGVAGVYFNDNTKIVLSSDATVFQYIERKRRSGSASSSASSTGEHVISTFPIASFPQELLKKVTLMKHFRNYLLDQQRVFGEGGDIQCGDTGGFPASVSTGFPATIVPDTNERMTLEALTSNASAIPFLKKWVKTRHAILFRLSNKTVQVVFFDKTEILLTAEAHIITYVSKEGIRSEHTLQNAIQSGRVDVIKRLKYAKDIMYKLINNTNPALAPMEHN